MPWTHRVMSGAEGGVVASVCRFGTGLVEPIYRAAMNRRNAGYDSGRKAIRRAEGIVVISIGNITAGGTGKTPMTRWLVERLIESGHKPAVLMRGYKGGGAGGSDEVRELGEALGGVPIVADADRVAGASTIVLDHEGVDVIVLDDGFQHRRLGRDVDLVLIDATEPFGFDHVLPRGLLREPVEGLKRADGVVLTRCELVSDAGLVALRKRIAEVTGREPIAEFEMRWAAVLDERGEAVELAGKRVVPFCGIGNPAAFFAGAAERCEVLWPYTFGDHHAYERGELGEMAMRAEAVGADGLLTTMKDWVKVGPLIESEPLGIPVWRAMVEMRPVRGGEALMGVVDGLFEKVGDGDGNGEAGESED